MTSIDPSVTCPWFIYNTKNSGPKTEPWGTLNNYCYQDDNAIPHRARVVLDFLQQANVTKMEQPPRSPDCNPIEHLWDELDRAISSMDNPPQNLDVLRQALLDKWAPLAPCSKYASTTSGDYRRERRECTILTWHTQNETTRQRHEKKSSSFDQIYHNYLPVTLRYAHSGNYSFYHQMSSKLTKNNIIKNRVSNTYKTLYCTKQAVLRPRGLKNRNNHQKDTPPRGVTTFFAKSVIYISGALL